MVRHYGLVESARTLGWKRLRVRFLAVSDIFILYPMFIEPTITRVSSRFSGYTYGLIHNLCEKKLNPVVKVYNFILGFTFNHRITKGVNLPPCVFKFFSGTIFFELECFDSQMM